MQALCVPVEGEQAVVQVVADELVRSKLLELLNIDRRSPDFLARYEEVHRLIGLAMEQQVLGETP